MKTPRCTLPITILLGPGRDAPWLRIEEGQDVNAILELLAREGFSLPVITVEMFANAGYEIPSGLATI